MAVKAKITAIDKLICNLEFIVYLLRPWRPGSHVRLRQALKRTWPGDVDRWLSEGTAKAFSRLDR